MTLNKNTVRPWLTLSVCLCIFAQTASCQESKSPRKADAGLTIGSAAPSLNIEHWVQNGQGKFKTVSNFEKGKIYVVEFWATWCGPCLASMPHLAELQTKYAKKGVQIISITDEDLETVQEFLKKKVRGKEHPEQSYKDLTNVYCLTADPDGSSASDYMTASGQKGIPCAFVVGKDGRIEWIGYPARLDEPLEKLVAGTWNRNAFAEMYKEEQIADQLEGSIDRKLTDDDFAGAIKLIDDYLATAKNKEIKFRMQLIRFQIQLSDPKKELLTVDSAKQFLSEISSNIPLLNQVTWKIYETSQAATIDIAVVKLARTFTEKAIPHADPLMLPNLLDTLAHLQFADGDINAALETQRTAIAKTPESERHVLTDFLKELEAKSKAK